MNQKRQELNQNISQTINLISDIEMSSKEQLLGIEQINDAVTQLDQQTQQNAMVASETHDIATITDEIAKLVLNDANAKEFEGKNEVKAKKLNTNPTSSFKESSLQVLEKNIETKANKNMKITSIKSSDDEWENF